MFCFCCYLRTTTAKVLYSFYQLSFKWNNQIFSIFHTDFNYSLFAVTLVKTTGREPYVTPICTNETLNIITFIICKIRTEESRGEECHLGFHYERGFEHGCDSRFTLMKKNQTIFLHLTSLTPVDSGNYSCECSSPGVTNTLHLNITVEGKHMLCIFPHTLIKFTVIIFHCVVLLTW